jgi:5-methylcytosine-specific restriction endonuclease McrA
MFGTVIRRNNIILWDVTQCGYLRNVQLLVTAHVIPRSPFLVTLMMKPLLSSETSVHTRATLRHIAENRNLHSHRSENLKSNIALTDWTL